MTSSWISRSCSSTVATRDLAARRVSEVAQTTLEQVFEVDSRLMQVHVLQQVFPTWDTLRIMRSRHDHLDWMHRQC